MKTKTITRLFIALCFFLWSNAEAQIKVNNDNSVNIGSLNGYFGVTIDSDGTAHFRTQDNSNYGWANYSLANNYNQKHWIVENLYNSDPSCLRKHMFYVMGNGCVVSTNQYTLSYSNNCLFTNNRGNIDGNEALSTIINLDGYYYENEQTMSAEEIENCVFVDDEAVGGMIADLEKSTVGLSAENMLKVFPDAIRTDPQARLCIDYNAVVTMLVEAVKQQQIEIESLRTTLQKNGLLKEKP